MLVVHKPSGAHIKGHYNVVQLQASFSVRFCRNCNRALKRVPWGPNGDPISRT